MSKDNQRLIDYSLGLLSKEEREALEREIASDERLKSELNKVSAVMTGLAEAIPPMKPSNQLKEKLFRSIEPQNRFEGFVERLVRFFDIKADAVRGFLQKVDLEPVATWEFSGLKGTYALHFSGGPKWFDAHCGLVYMEAGQAFPRHRHLGEEWNLIIQGQILEDSGKLFSPGDYLHKSVDSVHSFECVGDEPVVFAIISTGDMKIQR